MDISEAENSLWVDGSMVLYHNMLVQRRLAEKILVTQLAAYCFMHFIVEMLIQSMFANEVLLAVTAPKLGGVKGIEMLDQAGLTPESLLTFATREIMLLGTLMILTGSSTGE